MAVNADESEPGTFKDREMMEIEPHRVLEGIALCCYAIGAETAFIYIRGEYVEPADRLEAAIAEAEAAGLLGRDVPRQPASMSGSYVFRGAGAYICGEETALLESLEGRRPMPRSRPPFPAVEGLYRRPTVHQQRRDAGQRAGTSSAAAATGTTRSARRPATPARRSSASRGA